MKCTCHAHYFTASSSIIFQHDIIETRTTTVRTHANNICTLYAHVCVFVFLYATHRLHVSGNIVASNTNPRRQQRRRQHNNKELPQWLYCLLGEGKIVENKNNKYWFKRTLQIRINAPEERRQVAKTKSKQREATQKNMMKENKTIQNRFQGTISQQTVMGAVAASVTATTTTVCQRRDRKRIVGNSSSTLSMYMCMCVN